MTWATMQQRLATMATSDRQRRNVLDLVEGLRDCPPPKDVTINPNDGGVSCHWMGYEIATYDDRFETYEFEEGRTEIKDWPRGPDESVSPELIAEAQAFAVE
jgi:hypothetical protein